MKLQALVNQAVHDGLERAGISGDHAKVASEVGASLGRDGVLAEIGELKTLRDEIVRLANEKSSLELVRLGLENDRLKAENTKLHADRRQSQDRERSLRASLEERLSADERRVSQLELASQPITQELLSGHDLMRKIAESNRLLQAQLEAS